MAGSRKSCRMPRSVSVTGHWRELTGRRKKKRAPARPKAGRFWVAESPTGRVCSHHHRTAAGALRCAKAHDRKAAASRAGLTRKQAAKTRAGRWTVAVGK